MWTKVTAGPWNRDTFTGMSQLVWLQEDNGLPVHIKGGTSDVMLYRATMILSGIGGRIHPLLTRGFGWFGFGNRRDSLIRRYNHSYHKTLA